MRDIYLSRKRQKSYSTLCNEWTAFLLFLVSLVTFVWGLLEHKLSLMMPALIMLTALLFVLAWLIKSWIWLRKAQKEVLYRNMFKDEL